MVRYTESDIVSGKMITKSGMLAGYVNIPGKLNPQFRFIKKVGGDSKLQQGGGNNLDKPISLKSAVNLLRRYYKEKYN